MTPRQLPLRNLKRKPARTAGLLLLVLFLAFSLFAGTVISMSLQRGLGSLEARLGADIIVVPSSAKSKVDLDGIFLQGTTGYFYMDAGYVDKLQAISGVEQLSPQLFLASLRASCCTIPVQVIGIDQATDFSIQPWITKSYSKALGDLDVVVGCKVNADIGESIKIYGENCKVVARLDATGTGLDTAIYCSMDSLRHLLESARALGHDLKISGDPAQVISAVYIRVGDGYDIQKVVDDINLHVRKVQAVRTKSMLTGIADSLSGVSRSVRLLILVIWILCIVILLIAFGMLIHERKKEFAVLRVLGMSRAMLARMMLSESFLLSLMGSILGTALAALLVLPFSTLIEGLLNLPFLLPDTPALLGIALFTVLACLVIGPLSSAFAAFRLSRVDPAAILKEGA
ncbi:MAG: FtsX-like permease family protein [Clostridia bacterium]|nr:FtsX-like permease family protein [Clostridia bacterium]MBR1684533.1 FtsX-like permease family protein [Clostridia bacterium]